MVLLPRSNWSYVFPPIKNLKAINLLSTLMLAETLRFAKEYGAGIIDKEWGDVNKSIWGSILIYNLEILMRLEKVAKTGTGLREENLCWSGSYCYTGETRLVYSELRWITDSCMTILMNNLVPAAPEDRLKLLVFWHVRLFACGLFQIHSRFLLDVNESRVRGQ